MNFNVVLFAFLFVSTVNVQAYVISRQTSVSDGCATIYSEFITTQKTSFSYADAKDCYESFPFDKDVASKTIDTLTGLIGGFYSFLDKAKEPPQHGFDFRSMDLIAELELFRNKSYTTLYDFTKIKVFDDTIDRSNNDCEVTHIDGQQAFNVISDYAKNSVFMSRDPSVRFNIALDRAYVSFAKRTELPIKPDIICTLKCNNTNEFNIKRNWTAFASSRILNKFNDSKSYFDNICNPTKGSKQPASSSFGLRKIAKTFNVVNGILAERDQSVTIIRTVDEFVSFYKVQDFGVVKIVTEFPAAISDALLANVTQGLKDLNALLMNVTQGFKDLANTGVKKVVLDLSDNIGGLLYVILFFNLLLFPNTYPTFDFDIRVTEQMKLAITEQFKLATLNNIFDMSYYVNSKTRANFTSADDFIGNNIYTRGCVMGNYSNKHVVSDSSLNEIIQFIQNLTTPLPWKPEDYIILTNGLCGSACAFIAEHAVEYNNVTTVAVGGIASNPLLSYASFPGGAVINSTQIFDSLEKLGLLNNTLIPKPFPLTGTFVNFPMDEVYSKINPDEILEFSYRPAKFRLFYDEQNIRNNSILWSQAAALIGSK
ncbi:peptidase s41 family protein [Gigaspora margarita]|uniref:Peptidase s41 family protein n=1 Tax=Gigaspora margarita TaxID=4874 RepID=A0A8H4ENK8_GIGMA|nr:peptidase s41 family protein [Gigaspora margarita]